MTSHTVKLSELLALPVEERFELIELLWESVGECAEAPELSAAQKQELDDRLAAYERDPDAGVPWAELKARLLAGSSKGSRA